MNRPRWLVRIFVFLILGAIVNYAAVGCRSQHTPPATWLLDSPEGMTYVEFQTKLRSGTTTRGDGHDAKSFQPPQHHITKREHGNEVMLVSAEIEGARFCFVFESRRLAKSLDPIGGTPEQMLQLALNESGLTPIEYRARVEEARSARAFAIEHKEPFVLLHLFPSSRGDDYRTYVELMSKFDGSKVRLGAGREQIDAIFGRPNSIGRENGREIRIYGKNVEVGWYPPPEVSVEFVEGQASAVVTKYLPAEYEGAINR